MDQSTLLENYLTFEALVHRYFSWKRREQGPRANPHRGQGRILSILKLQPQISQKEMIYLLDMRPQSLGELLTKLEKAGFITRAPSEEDRRVMIITLTEAGAAEAEKLNQLEEPTIFDALSGEEQIQLEEILGKLIRSIESQLPEDAIRSGKFPHHPAFEGFSGAHSGFERPYRKGFNPEGRRGGTRRQERAYSQQPLEKFRRPLDSRFSDREDENEEE